MLKVIAIKIPNQEGRKRKGRKRIVILLIYISIHKEKKVVL
jgi:hypothetical protein